MYILRTKKENALEISFPSIAHLLEINMTSTNVISMKCNNCF